MPSSRLRRRAKRILASALNDLASDLVHLILSERGLTNEEGRRRFGLVSGASESSVKLRPNAPGAPRDSFPHDPGSIIREWRVQSLAGITSAWTEYTVAPSC